MRGRALPTWERMRFHGNSPICEGRAQAGFFQHYKPKRPSLPPMGKGGRFMMGFRAYSRTTSTSNAVSWGGLLLVIIPL